MIGALLSHHQRSFFLQPLRTKTEVPKWTLCRVRDLGTRSPKWNLSIKSHPSGIKEPSRRGDRNSIRTRGYEYQENNILSINWSKHIWRKLQGMKQYAESSQMVLYVFVMTFCFLFMGFLSVLMNGYLFHVPSLQIFSFCWFGLSYSDVWVFVLPYCILFYTKTRFQYFDPFPVQTFGIKI